MEIKRKRKRIRNSEFSSFSTFIVEFDLINIIRQLDIRIENRMLPGETNKALSNKWSAIKAYYFDIKMQMHVSAPQSTIS